jgi:gentisate 1,2-dioxygenase
MSKEIPDWLKSYPFPSGKKEPIHRKFEEGLQLVYGKDGRLFDYTPLHFISDKIVLGEYTVPPGEHFTPPDVHPGDECYYCLEGNAVIFDPVHGDAIEMNPGDALYIPKGTFHAGYNFGNVNFRILAVLAPKIWSEDDMGVDIEFKEKPLYYKGEK